MNTLDDVLLIKIGCYCDIKCMNNLSQTNKRIKKNTKLQIYIPDRIYTYLFGDENRTAEIIREDMKYLRSWCVRFPSWRSAFWKEISDYLCNEHIKRGHPSVFKTRRLCSFALDDLVRNNSFIEAKQCIKSSSTYTFYKRNTHEIFRLDRLRYRNMRNKAFSALALIY